MPVKKERFWTIVATCLAFVIIQLDVTIVNVAIPSISMQLDSDISGMQWIIDAYTLALAVVLLMAGVLGDRWGSRRIFLAGFSVFGFASLVCGMSTSTELLIAARAVQGFGGALVLPTSLALIAHACKGDDVLRAKAVSIWAASGAIATAAGPILGGLLVSTIGWSWIFYVNVPICIFATFITIKVISETTRSNKGQFDFLGQIIITVGLLVLISSLIRAGSHGLGDNFVTDGIIIFAISITAFLIRQATAYNPIVPLHLFRILPFSSSVLSASLLSLTFYGLIFVLSLYFHHVLGYSPAETGAAFLPLTGVIVIANLASVSLIRKVGYRVAISGGLFVAALGYAYLALMPNYSALLPMVPGMMMVTLGMGTAIPATTTVVIGSVDKNISGTASAILNTGRQFAGALGVAVFGAIVSDHAATIAVNIREVYVISALVLVLAMFKSMFCIGKSIVPYSITTLKKATA
ncbi:MFS transporter [Zooshikella harenae]|uniref:MFS transporter n=1 Tax=Zooshikella harenae TaxID=2827238 RepID=A0ABS5ZIR6_9GAMM|nr:MFS transporter [Zooshikella harenae]MBU2713773.1 MFS transporter [Zooshikella harenae]